jgi:3-methyladenine DNA glycosylase AlkC
MLLKNIYSTRFIDQFSEILALHLADFNTINFKNSIFDASWEKRELKDRMKHIAMVLNQHFPQDFEKASHTILQIINTLQQNKITEGSLEFMFFPEYIEQFGIDDFENATYAMEVVTQFTSCEFAVRPFIIRYDTKMMDKMEKWTQHPNHHVRRLASEGSRPRLPWAIALPKFKKDPTPLLTILENLKNDESEYVRRSVANNINDISKDHPDVVIALAQKWKNTGSQTDALIKHGCRTLLKAGNKDILTYYNLHNTDHIITTDLFFKVKKVAMGENLVFSFSIKNSHLETATIRIEYAIYFLRQNGQLNKKVFKISEREWGPNESKTIEKSHSFRPITTRKYYTGHQKLSIIINGKEELIGDFELV